MPMPRIRRPTVSCAMLPLQASWTMVPIDTNVHAAIRPPLRPPTPPMTVAVRDPRSSPTCTMEERSERVPDFSAGLPLVTVSPKRSRKAGMATMPVKYVLHGGSEGGWSREGGRHTRHIRREPRRERRRSSTRARICGVQAQKVRWTWVLRVRRLPCRGDVKEGRMRVSSELYTRSCWRGVKGNTPLDRPKMTATLGTTVIRNQALLGLTLMS